MYYEINVTKNGKHYFATAPRSLKTLKDANELWEQFKILFPIADGFDMSLINIETSHKVIRRDAK